MRAMPVLLVGRFLDEDVWAGGVAAAWRACWQAGAARGRAMVGGAAGAMAWSLGFGMRVLRGVSREVSRGQCQEHARASGHQVGTVRGADANPAGLPHSTTCGVQFASCGHEVFLPAGCASSRTSRRGGGRRCVRWRGAAVAGLASRLSCWPRAAIVQRRLRGLAHGTLHSRGAGSPCAASSLAGRDRNHGRGYSTEAETLDPWRGVHHRCFG